MVDVKGIVSMLEVYEWTLHIINIKLFTISLNMHYDRICYLIEFCFKVARKLYHTSGSSGGSRILKGGYCALT